MIAGIVVDGYAEGSMVNLELNGDGNKVAVGTAGETCFVKSRNFSGKIVFRLMASSNTNALFSALALAGNPVVPAALAVPGIGIARIFEAGMLERDIPPGGELAGDAPVIEWAFIFSKAGGIATGSLV